MPDSTVELYDAMLREVDEPIAREAVRIVISRERFLTGAGLQEAIRDARAAHRRALRERAALEAPRATAEERRAGWAYVKKALAEGRARSQARKAAERKGSSDDVNAELVPEEAHDRGEGAEQVKASPSPRSREEQLAELERMMLDETPVDRPTREMMHGEP